MGLRKHLPAGSTSYPLEVYHSSQQSRVRLQKFSRALHQPVTFSTKESEERKKFLFTSFKWKVDGFICNWFFLTSQSDYKTCIGSNVDFQTKAFPNSSHFQ